MPELDLRRGRWVSARLLFARSKVVVAGLLGDAVFSLVTLLWEPLKLADYPWIAWMPRWGWGCLAAALFVVLVWEVFHRLRDSLLDRLDASEAAQGQLRRVLEGEQPFVSDCLTIVRHGVARKQRPPEFMAAATRQLGGSDPLEFFAYVVVRTKVDVVPRITVKWSKAVTSDFGGGQYRANNEGYGAVAKGGGEPRALVYQFAAPAGGGVIPAGTAIRLEVNSDEREVHSLQVIAYPAETQQGPAG